ncbi:4-hydroxy-tetrahydrodipicolinate reductase [Idiomarina ramblicola]|uniref:4-hydroxy-tetrahydrodipicolinate reductase n=1 Tax=Idiomarina ramblicola TaxID=263724 RepID=A0A432YZ89_9GAMM|nr:4-hydroxy-tetrahydrodipicolinate reductase [Idiomarina ramblicola]RUO68930.1 4-hydroxy-tetrahydrodipicolinate reductase [Idiomarina ramblicola]
MINVGVFGASGRMGKAVIQALTNDSDAKLAAAIVRKNSSSYGQSATENEPVHFISAEELQPDEVDVLIDFSLPEALTENLKLAEQYQLPIVVCTTGLNDKQKERLAQAAETVPVLYASNTSIGIALLEQLVGLSSAALPDADIEIFEAHHRHKKDGPSGTAISLGEAAAKGRNQRWEQVNDGIRGEGPRSDDGIGFSVMRAADIVGEHQVTLAVAGERIEIGHRVSDRKIFADGALRAGKWLQEQAPGLYSLQDTLDLQNILQRMLKR